jgi:hypothetical protein
MSRVQQAMWLGFDLFRCQPTIGKEIIHLRDLGGRESGQHIFHVFERIDAQALTSFDQTHYRSGSLTAFLRASEEPVASRNDHRLDASFACVVADFDERVFEVDQECRPTIKCVYVIASPSFVFGSTVSLASSSQDFKRSIFGLANRWRRSNLSDSESVVATLSMSKRLLITPMGNSASTGSALQASSK